MPKRFGSIAGFLSGSLASIAVSAVSPTWWSKGTSYFNAEAADLINAAPAPLVVSDRGHSYTNKGNLISLSYRLDPDVRLLLLSYPPDPAAIQPLSTAPDTPIFVYRPSGNLRNALESMVGELEAMSYPAGLWRVMPSNDKWGRSHPLSKIYNRLGAISLSIDR